MLTEVSKTCLECFTLKKNNVNIRVYVIMIYKLHNVHFWLITSTYNIDTTFINHVFIFNCNNSMLA